MAMFMSRFLLSLFSLFSPYFSPSNRNLSKIHHVLGA
jgi:hypothetical protein